MTDRPVASTDDLVAEYVRATMRVEPPPALAAEVMRSVTALPQERRSWLSTFGPYTPAIAAVAAAGMIIAIGFVITGPRNIGPPAESTAPSPAPTLTPEDARILTEPGDVIRIPAFDSQGQFGMIRLERGDEYGSYPDYMPLAAMEHEGVFFVEVHVTYEVDRATNDPYGNIDFGWAVDADRDGLDDDDVIYQYNGYDINGLELETGPSPLLPFVNSEPEMRGWIPLELPVAGAEYDIYLLQLADRPNEPPAVYTPFTAVASALLRNPGEPVGMTIFDWDNPPPMTEPEGPLASFQQLPTPLPSPAATFEPAEDAEADALFLETQSCSHDTGVTIIFPSTWHTNDAFEDLPACNWFAPEPIDVELVYHGLTDSFPPIMIHESLSWMGGAVDQPNVPRADTSTRVPIGGRLVWLINYPEGSPSVTYLIPLTEDPYGPFVRATTGGESRAVLERMLVLLEFPE